MTRPPSLLLFPFFLLLPLCYLLPFSVSLGSGRTLAVSSDSSTVCGIVSSQSTQSISCYRRSGELVPVQPNVSFSSIAGGQGFFCGLRSGGYSLHCWDINTSNYSNFNVRRLYYNATFLLDNLSAGDGQVCATVGTNSTIECWRSGLNWTTPSDGFSSITSGVGFTCGILTNSSTVRCWGSNAMAGEIQSQFGNSSMYTIMAGGSHVCGLNSTGFLVCKGDNSSGQLNFVSHGANEFSSLALGLNHSCAIRSSNGSVVCWGGGGAYSVNVTNGVSFESIVSGVNFTCGLTTSNFSVICWGPGWVNGSSNSSSLLLPLPSILPGPCVASATCQCEIYPGSQGLCSGSGEVCKSCVVQSPPAPPPPALTPGPSPPAALTPSSSSRSLTRGLLAFAIVGSVGAFAGICTVIYCLYTGVCFGKKKVHNSVQPTITAGGGGGNSNGGTASNSSPVSKSSSLKRQFSRQFSRQYSRQYSRGIRRQRSGTSSKHGDRAEEFSFYELGAATNGFSLENKIGAGSFGVVYKGKLSDGREVAIKRGDQTGSKAKKFQEKESAFDSELSFLSRLHHKHLVRLVGFCEENDERLLVYDFMKNGALYDHLHDKNNTEKRSSVVNSWKLRIKIALDAARGIEYLHNYAVPPIIHRDIKSSNILLDSNWVARVSDFGLSLMGPDAEQDNRPAKAAGTVGYIDPEYYGLNVLTAKSDVYGLGVVLLELLTGKRAIFKNEDEGGAPVSVVDFAAPVIEREELFTILDPRVGPPEFNESEGVELVGYTAMHCVRLEGKDRPTMSDIVANLERALSVCEGSHGSISSGTVSIVSE